jgi:rare lipoprotein A
MFGFRLFWTLSMAICLCVLNWGQAQAADAAASNLRLVAAAPVKPVKIKTDPNENKAHGAQASTKAGKRTKNSAESAGTQAKKSVAVKTTQALPKEKNAVKRATAPLDSKHAAHSWVKHKKHGLLPPPSADLPQSGIASWVGKLFHGKPVAAGGEVHAMESFTAAHRAIALHSILKVTDMKSGRSVLVRVNDRGPYVKGRVIDLAKAAAEYLGYAGKGLTTVRLELAGNDKDPAQRYYIRLWPRGAGKVGSVQGFGPFDKFDEAASLFASLYKSYPNAELTAVREES